MTEMIIIIPCYVIAGTFFLGLTDEEDQTDYEMMLMRIILWPLFVLCNCIRLMIGERNIFEIVNTNIQNIYKCGSFFRRK